jgi:hypothetical protein
VKLFGWDDDAQIKEDLTLYETCTQRDHVLLEVIFPKVRACHRLRPIVVI